MPSQERASHDLDQLEGAFFMSAGQGLIEDGNGSIAALIAVWAWTLPIRKAGARQFAMPAAGRRRASSRRRRFRDSAVVAKAARL